MIKEYKITNFPLSLKYFSPRSDFLGGCIVSQSELICLWRKSECIRYIPSFFESGIWEEFCWMVLSWVFHEVVVKVLAGASIISGVDTSGRLASKWLTHMAVSWRPVTFFTGLFECPHGMAADFSQSGWYKRRQWGSHTTFYVLISEATQSYCHFNHILSSRSEPLNIVHSQRRGISLRFFEGRNVKEFMDIF